MSAETLSDEFSRLVREYHDDPEGPTGPEAWNLLADFSVENAEGISVALASLEAKDAEIKRLARIATDRLYMMDAYKAMLGPTALQVVKQWEANGVTRQHTDWGPEAHALSGEERAQALLDAEKAVGTSIDFDDSNLPKQDFRAAFGPSSPTPHLKAEQEKEER